MRRYALAFILIFLLVICSFHHANANNLELGKLKLKFNKLKYFIPLGLISAGGSQPYLLIMGQLKNDKYVLMLFQINKQNKGVLVSMFYESFGYLFSASFIDNGKKSMLYYTANDGDMANVYRVKNLTNKSSKPEMMYSYPISDSVPFGATKIAPWGNGYVAMLMKKETKKMKTRVSVEVQQYDNNGNEMGKPIKKSSKAANYPNGHYFMQPVSAGDYNVFGGYKVETYGKMSELYSIQVNKNNSGNPAVKFRRQGAVWDPYGMSYPDSASFNSLGQSGNQAIYTWYSRNNMDKTEPGSWNMTSTNTNKTTQLDLPGLNDAIFVDGFESGDTSAWTSSVPNAPDYTFLRVQFSKDRTYQQYSIFSVSPDQGEGVEIAAGIKTDNLQWPERPAHTIMRGNELFIVWGGSDQNGKYTYYVTRYK